MRITAILFAIFFSSIFKLTAKKSDTDSIAMRLIDSAAHYCHVDNELALIYGKEALQLSKEENTKANALKQLGIIYKNKALLDSSLTYFYQAVEIYESLIDNNNDLSKSIPEQLSTTYNELAEINADNANPQKAIEHNNMALALSKECSLTSNLIHAYLTRSKIYWHMGLPDSSKEASLKGLNLSLKIGNNDLSGRLYNNIGGFYYHQQAWDSCLYYFEKAYELKKGSSTEKELVPTLNNLGLINYVNKNFTQAILYLKEAEQLAEKNKLSLSKAISLYYQVNTYLDMQKHIEAKKAFEQYEVASSEYYDLEKKKQIEELDTKYQTAQKENEIKSLQKENEIKDQKVKAKNRLLILLSILIILSLALIFLYLKLNRLKNKSIQNELKIKNLQIEQKMLRSQMNPHFIYNSLNSIQSFISENESYLAEKYLARFAKLMRGILEHSRKEFVLLDDELELLEIYMELEKLRFNNKFDYRISIDEEIASDFIEIPPMIIQPFIENSIKHGFKNKEKGLIKIDFNINEETIRCTIEDNGIGRKASMNEKTSNTHNSLGMDITNDRLVNISSHTKSMANFNVIDLYDGDKPKGTKVIIDLPFQEK